MDPYEYRVARLERDVKELQDNREESIETRILVKQLGDRVNRMAAWSMAASGLLVGVLGILLILLKLK